MLGRRGNPRIPCFANEVLNLDCEPHGGRSYFMGLTSPRPSEESVPSRRSINICPGQENEGHSEQPSAGSLDFLNNTDFGDSTKCKKVSFTVEAGILIILLTFVTYIQKDPRKVSVDQRVSQGIM